MQELCSDESVDSLRAPWDATVCPQCGALAEVEWRAVLDSTGGPVEHAKVLCSQRHWFLLPVATLADGDAEPRGRRDDK